MKVNMMGISYDKHVKLGERLISIGIVSTITGLIILKNTSQWRVMNDNKQIDEVLDLYKKYI